MPLDMKLKMNYPYRKARTYRKLTAKRGDEMSMKAILLFTFFF
jgi:hypothetical protein